MRVIVMKGDGFTDAAGAFHSWGAELAIADGSELDVLLADGVVREDDRARRAAVAKPDYSEEVPDGE